MNLIKKNILPFILCILCIFSIPNSWALENYVGELFKTGEPISLYTATQAKKEKENLIENAINTMKEWVWLRFD